MLYNMLYMYYIDYMSMCIYIYILNIVCSPPFSRGVELRTKFSKIWWWGRGVTGLHLLEEGCLERGGLQFSHEK